MPATDNHGSSVSLSNYGRSIFSLRRDQVDGGTHGGHDGSSTSSGGHDADIEAFQKLVNDRFSDLAAVPAEELLTLAWLRKLLEAFLCCQEEFRVVLSSHRAQFSRPPTDRLVADFYERTVKALDVCNAIRDGIEQIRQWQKLLEIVICALDNNKNQKSLGEGQFRRAKKALIDLAIGMLDEKDSAHQQLLAHRNRSFGRKDSKSLCHFRSLSWSVSRSWSAARQLQAIGNNLAAPKGNDINGLSVPIFTMGSVLLFVMWVLVAAIPCQDRGLQVHFNIPRQFAWATPLHSLHDRILEEYKKRDRRNSCGLLREIHQIEKCSRLVNELGDSAQFPLPDEKVIEVMQRVQELAQVSALIKEGLDPLERQVREAFHRIVLSRTEGIDSIGRVNTN